MCLHPSGRFSGLHYIGERLVEASAIEFALLINWNILRFAIGSHRRRLASRTLQRIAQCHEWIWLDAADRLRRRPSDAGEVTVGLKRGFSYFNMTRKPFQPFCRTTRAELLVSRQPDVPIRNTH